MPPRWSRVCDLVRGGRPFLGRQSKRAGVAWEGVRANNLWWVLILHALSPRLVPQSPFVSSLPSLVPDLIPNLVQSETLKVGQPFLTTRSLADGYEG